MTSGVSGQPQSEGLGTRAVRGAAFLALRSVVVMGVGFFRVALVARVLGPDELGIFTLVIALVEASRALTTLGPAAVLIQRETIDSTYVDTYWVFKIAQAALTGLLVIASYPLVAATQPASALLPLHVLVGAAVTIAGFGSPGDMVATREARFDRIAAFEMIMAVLDCAVVVGLTLWLDSVIALGIGLLVRSVIEALLSFRFFPTRVAFRVHAHARKEYLHAGAHFLVLALGTYVTIYGDNALIGLLFGAHALGLYAAAYRLAEIPLSMLFAITKRLLFPVLSRLRSDRDRLESAVPDTILIQMLVLCPCAAGAIVFGDTLVIWAFGDDYADAGTVLKCLSLLTLARGVANISSTMLQASARFDLVSRLKWLGVVVFVPGVLAGMFVAGLNGAAIGAGIGYAATAVTGLVVAWDDLGIPRSRLARPFVAPFVCSTGAGLAGGATQVLAGPIGGVASFVVVYALLASAVERQLVGSLLERARRAWRARTAPASPAH